jgi:hypothetical protein
MAQVVQHLPSKCETLSINPNTFKINNTTKKFSKSLERDGHSGTGGFYNTQHTRPQKDYCKTYHN